MRGFLTRDGLINSGAYIRAPLVMCIDDGNTSNAGFIANEAPVGRPGEPARRVGHPG
jgi:hypothetical protein